MEDDQQQQYNYESKSIGQLAQEHYLLVWGTVILFIVAYINRYRILALIPEKKVEFKKETLEEFDENVRVARLKLQDRMNVVAKDQIEDTKKKEVEKKLNPKPKKSSGSGAPSTILGMEVDYSRSLNGGDNRGSFRPSYSMRNQGGCGSGGCP
ncbi:hypothetical protein PPL_06167 [Heterostelium album PN500]|uniref:Selenoprotein S n=1 Tax=Heterostelium pallidum (strain ATCC 26659 / Pp 5 / PN500) TaxID=670386 RepID=D3BCE2_HETP5|nr:hypothetical protein PPL_06167 [Heterostelium album PN500]EFA80932.1 hypothetical protein PPL_06167 [Heterostelium album PN500]|eukprot:XP_020433050.1 hypothetical protein PPL_06167 [Heterostelium album PN500]